MGQPSDVTVFAVSDNLVRALSIRRTIAELLSELGTILERIDASVSVDSSPAAPVSEPEVVDGKSH